MKTRLLLFLIGLALLQSLLVFISIHKMNIQGLVPVVIIRFIMFLVILLAVSRAINLTKIHSTQIGSRLLHILNYISLICTFLFSPLNGLLISLIYFYFSDWPMNISAQNTSINEWYVYLQMLSFLVVPFITMIVSQMKWNTKKTNANIS